MTPNRRRCRPRTSRDLAGRATSLSLACQLAGEARDPLDTRARDHFHGEAPRPELREPATEAVLKIRHRVGEGAQLTFAAGIEAFRQLADDHVVDAIGVGERTTPAGAERLARRVVRDFAKTARAIEEDATRVHEEVRRRPDVPGSELDAFRRLLGLP